MIRNFFKDEKGQGAIEYIMLVGGVVVAAVVVSIIYQQAALHTADTFNASVNRVTGIESKEISNELLQF